MQTLRRLQEKKKWLSFDDAMPIVQQQNEAAVPNELIKELEKVDVNVLTPIEALNILNKLKSLI